MRAHASQRYPSYFGRDGQAGQPATDESSEDALLFEQTRSGA